MKSLPKLVIFGDPKKGPVAEAIEEFARFVKDRAEIAASYRINDLVGGGDYWPVPPSAPGRGAQPSTRAADKARILKECR